MKQRSNSRAQSIQDEMDRLVIEVAELKRTVANSLRPRESIPAFNFGDGTAVVRSRGQFVFLPVQDYRSLLTLAFEQSIHEPGTTVLIRSLLKPGATAIDVGAHIGLLTMPMAHAVGDAGRVIAVEPHPVVRQCLSRNVQCNGYDGRVTILPIAAYSEKTECILRESVDGSMLSSIQGNWKAAGIPVEGRDLDSELPYCHGVDLIKIDAEGAELEILKGMQQIIGRSPSVNLIIEFAPAFIRRNGTSVEEWLDSVSSAGFSNPLMIDESTGATSPLPENTAEFFSTNLLFRRIPDPA